MEEKTEIERAREVLSKEVVKIEIYQRLLENPDFQEFKKELIENKIESLMDIMSDCEDKDLARIRGQIEALRGLMKIFEMTLKRKAEVQNKLQSLK